MNIVKLPRHTNRVTVRFIDAMYAKLRKDAKRAGVSVSEVVRQCVEYPVKTKFVRADLVDEVTRNRLEWYVKKPLNDFDPELKAQGLEE